MNKQNVALHAVTTTLFDVIINVLNVLQKYSIV